MAESVPPYFAAPAPEEPGFPRPRPRRWLVGFLLLASLTGIVALGVVVWLRSGQALTQEKLAAARQRWEAAGSQNYDMAITVTGRTQAEYHLEVRRGEIQTATLNGQPFLDGNNKLDVRRAYYWTVPGLFEVMETELTNTARPDAPPCYSQVEFDPQDGHPRRFLRSTSGHNTLIEVDFRRLP